MACIVQPKRTLEFDGTGMVQCDADASLNGSSEFCISFWASATAFRSTDSSIAIRQGNSASNLLIIYPYDTIGGLGPRIYYRGTFVSIKTGSPVADGTENHFLFMSRSATDHELFINGVSVVTSSAPKTLPTNLDFIEIGAWKNTQRFIGKIRDVRVFNSANLPTPDEIQKLARQSDLVLDPLNTVLHVKGETINGATAYDSSGNGYHGVITGGGTENITHFGVWTLAVGGEYLFGGTCTEQALIDGNPIEWIDGALIGRIV